MVEAVLPVLETYPAGAKEPMWMHWTCYCILAAVEDPRAPKVLVEAQRLLAEQAAALQEEGWRRAFLEEVEVHRAIRRAEHPAANRT